MIDKLVSVVMPTYNRANMIEKAIESVLNQTYPLIELVIVDDESTDNTEEMVRNKYMEYFNCTPKDRRSIKYFYSNYVGIPGVRNIAVRESSGQYIAFLDSDDYWNPHKIEIQADYLDKHPDCQIVFSDYENVLESGESFPNSNQLRLLSEEYQMYLASSCLRKELFTSIGFFDEKIQNGQDDYEWVCRAKMCGTDMSHMIDQVLYYRTIHGGNISLGSDAYGAESKKKVWMKAIRNAKKRRENADFSTDSNI